MKATIVIEDGAVRIKLLAENKFESRMILDGKANEFQCNDIRFIEHSGTYENGWEKTHSLEIKLYNK